LAHFLRQSRKKPGYTGLRYRSGPGAVRRGRFAPLLSLARAKKRPPAVLSPYGVFATQKLQAMETADILSAIYVIFGLGVFAARKPREWKQPASMPARLSALRAVLLFVMKVNADALGET
jgi:hypothetical protein